MSGEAFADLFNDRMDQNLALQDLLALQVHVFNRVCMLSVSLLCTCDLNCAVIGVLCMYVYTLRCLCDAFPLYF